MSEKVRCSYIVLLENVDNKCYSLDILDIMIPFIEKYKIVMDVYGLWWYA